MAAVDDCISAVIASPIPIKASTPTMLDHQRTSGPNTAGRSAGRSCSARPLIPCCSVVNPNSTSANPAGAAPAADTGPRPSSLIKAPTKIIGNAAAVSETRTPMSAMSQPVPVVPMFAPNTRARPLEKVSSPALTRPMVVIVVALDDCTISVTNAPQNVPDSGVAAALLRVVRSPGPASAFRPPVMTLMPSRKRPTPPRTEIVVDMRAAGGSTQTTGGPERALTGSGGEESMIRGLSPPDHRTPSLSNSSRPRQQSRDDHESLIGDLHRVDEQMVVERRVRRDRMQLRV